MTNDADDMRRRYFEAVTDFTLDSGITVKAVYTPEDIGGIDFERDRGLPGEYPFARGNIPQMYRRKLWNMREISGVATPAIFNKRLKFLMQEGASALDCINDSSTFYAIEPDQPSAEGMVGNCGVCLAKLQDVDDFSKDIPLDQVSMCFSGSHAPHMTQAYLMVAKKRGYNLGELRIVPASLHYHFPVIYPGRKDILLKGDGGLSSQARWANDFAEYLLKNMPKTDIWYGDAYDIRQRGANAIQEIAFDMAARKEMIHEMLKRGIDIDTIGKRLSTVFSVERDFFEEIAKFRAARKVCARVMKEEFGATDPRAMMLRYHVNVSGVGYTAKQPLVNIARGALQGLAAVLAGTQGLQIPSFDEAFGTPTEQAARIALRTQQVIRYESGVAKVADPLGGSFYIEWLTNKLESEIESTLSEIEQRGGWLAVLQSGWAQQRVTEGHLAIEKKVQTGERMAIGENCFVIPPEEDFQPQIYAPEKEDIRAYIAEHKEFRRKRDSRRVKEAVSELRRAVEHTEESLIPSTFEAVEAGVTFPEIVGVLRVVDGMDYDPCGEREYPF